MTVPAGHEVDELQLIRGRGQGTLGWVESWLDATGSYSSQVALLDLRTGGSPRGFAASCQIASALTAPGDADGDQVVAWKDCDPTPTCRLWAVYRRGGGRFGAPAALGVVDSYKDPAAAISRRGEALVGWIAAGRVIAAARSRQASRFGAPRVVSAGSSAGDLSLAFSPGGQALTTWTAWSATPQVLGALLG